MSFFVGDLKLYHLVDEAQAFSAAESYSDPNNGNDMRVEVWVAGNDREKEGCHVWSDGSPSLYMPWKNPQPDNYAGIEHCVTVFDIGPFLNDEPCSDYPVPGHPHHPKVDAYVCRKFGKIQYCTC